MKKIRKIRKQTKGHKFIGIKKLSKYMPIHPVSLSSMDNDTTPKKMLDKKK